MGTADPLSRLSRKEHRLNNLDLPLMLEVLLQRLPDSVRKAMRIRVNAEKDDAVATRIVQRWREPTNVISNTRGNAPGEFDFLITAPFADKITHKIADLIRMDSPFAALMPISLLNETDRNADGTIDKLVRSRRQNMPVIVVASLGMAWLINHPESKLDKSSKHYVLLAEQNEYPAQDKLMQACLSTWTKTITAAKVDTHKSKDDIQSLVVRAVDNLMRDGALRPKPPCFIQTKSGLSYGELPVTKPTGKTKRARAQQGASSKSPAKRLKLSAKATKTPSASHIAKEARTKNRDLPDQEICKKDKESE